MSTDGDVFDLISHRVDEGLDREVLNGGLELEAAVWGETDINQAKFFETLEKRAKEARSRRVTVGFDKNDLTYNRNGDQLSESIVIGNDHQGKGTGADDFNKNIRSHKRLLKLRKRISERSICASEYERRLREQYIKLHPTPDWAQREEDIVPDEYENYCRMLRTSSAIINKAPLCELDSGKLSVTRLVDIAASTQSTSTPTSICFQAGKPIACTAGRDCVLRIYYIDGKSNTLFESIQFKNYPIRCVAAAPDSKEIAIVGRERHYYVFMTSDRTIKRCELAGFFASRMSRSHTMGAIPIISCHYSHDNKYMALVSSSSSITIVFRDTKQIYTQLNVNETTRTVCFCPLGKHIYILTTRGKVFKFNLDSKTCVYKFKDQGCVRAKSIDISPSGDLIAIGSNSGVVNLYKEHPCSINNSPVLIKSITNLTTSANIVKFNPQGQILAIASSAKKGALKLFNIINLQTFYNWPTCHTPLRYIKALAFSSDSKYLTIANSNGRIVLYKLNPYA